MDAALFRVAAQATSYAGTRCTRPEEGFWPKHGGAEHFSVSRAMGREYMESLGLVQYDSECDYSRWVIENRALGTGQQTETGCTK